MGGGGLIIRGGGAKHVNPDYRGCGWTLIIGEALIIGGEP